ncbi:MAG: hypothetical protein JST36_05390 [Bacteroidetes bacterium]|nr:hypothetical protein [Bacteroidota bacterium]
MPKQSGPLPIEGTLGDLIFYKTIHGHLVRRKGNLNKERVSTEAAFEGSRKASSEFGRAGAASGLLRNEIKKHCPYVGDGQTHARLSKLFGEIIRADKTQPVGQRQVQLENIAPLKQFEWKQDHPLSRSFWGQCGGSMSPEGKLCITMNAFDPKRDLAWPHGATHAVLSVVCLSANFSERSIVSDAAQSTPLAKNNIAVNLSLNCQIPILDNNIVLAGIGVQFFEGEKPMIEGSGFGLVG